MLEEAKWMAEHGFAGVWTPNYTAMPGQIPIYDAHWDPLWAAYAESNLVLITHAGWGLPQGFMHGEIEAAVAENNAEKGDRASLNKKLLAGVFGRHGVFSDLRSRQGMWQLMLSGVFDRHPKLKMMETEVRADWIPATLKALDEVWAKNKDKLPAKRAPSEMWRSNCMAGLSFMNRTEVEMRHEIGVETMAFGRDYPHTEGTWPNTIEYFSEIMRGVPENETRAILGENMTRFLGLDRAKMAKIAADIGAPTYQQIADGPALSQAMIDHLGIRSGYKEPAEGGKRLAEIEPMLRGDVKRIAAAALAY
jgi:predicted TIM-barrel fold metal-dependent hydrolase